ncbi:MAG: FAD-dependent oxidoreductase [Granulosicoccus sp.]|nr:FAD-dependent oxidoreductase [Granulosicoccus sp.]
MSNQFDIIIVGTGHAGYTLARNVHKRSPDLSMLLITADDGSYYSKPMLSNGLAKNKSAQDLAAQSSEAMAASLDATIITRTRVTSIEPATKSIVTDSADYQYQSLVLACGAQQIKLPIQGDGAEDTLTVNDLDDYALFRERLTDVSQVAVMGPGLIGCEFANDLATVGKTTIIIGPDTRPLERLVPEPASAALKQAMDTLGVQWHLETVVQQIDRTATGYLLTLASGVSVEAGLVISAAGLKPDLTLAIGAGLETRQGIVVDGYLRTSDPDIYALGDCAEVEGQVLPYIMPIMHAARALSSTLSGTPEKVTYPAMPVVIKTPVHPVVVAVPGDKKADAEWITEGTDAGVKARYESSDGQLLGFVLTGELVKEKSKLERELPKP